MSLIKSLVKLSGEPTQQDFDFRSCSGVVLEQGNHTRGIQLTQSGLVAYKGKVFVGISKEELWKLFEEIEPQFKAPQSGPEKSANGK